MSNTELDKNGAPVPVDAQAVRDMRIEIVDVFRKFSDKQIEAPAPVAELNEGENEEPPYDPFPDDSEQPPYPEEEININDVK